MYMSLLVVFQEIDYEIVQLFRWSGEWKEICGNGVASSHVPLSAKGLCFHNKYDGDKKQDCWFAGSEVVQPLTEVPETAGYKDTRTSGGGVDGENIARFVCIL
jgi:hypothetical protein